MVWRKKMKFFSTTLLKVALIIALLSNQGVGFAFGGNRETPAETSTADAGGSTENENASANTQASQDGIFVLGGVRPTNDIVSESVYVYNMDMGVEVYSKNADRKVWPASVTKIMTALVVLENESNLEKKAKFPQLVTAEFVSDDPNKRGAATAGFDLGCDITLRDALYGLMLPSGCEAANILAYNVGKGEGAERIDNFVKMMNKKAKEIGATGTNFSNAHGLFEPTNYTTARDMFLITNYVYKKYPLFAEIVRTFEYAVPISQYNPNGEIINTNRFLRPASIYYNESVIGVKTGGFDDYSLKSTDGSWVTHDGIANLVSIASKDGYEYMVVTMEAPWKTDLESGQHELHYAYTDHRTLFNWAFSTFKKTCVMRDTDLIAVVKVLDGTADEVQLFPLIESDFWTLLPEGLDAGSTINRKIKLASDECTCDNLPDDCECNIREGVVTAPVFKGDKLGTLELWVGGQRLGEHSIPLVAGDSVALSSSAKTRRTMEGVLGQWWFILLLLVAGATAIVLIILSYIHRHRKQLARKRRKPPNRRIRR